MRVFASIGRFALTAGLAFFMAQQAPAQADEKPSDTIEAGILMTAPPFSYVNNGQQKGITYDLLNAIAKDQGFKIHLNPMGFDAMIPAMQAHQIDVAVAGFFVTDVRKKIIDFSEPFFTEGSALAVPIDSPIKSYDDLKGKTIVSQQGSAALSVLQGIAPERGVDVRAMADEANLLMAVQSGNADGIFFDSAIVAYRISLEGDKPTLRIVGEVQHPTDIAFALPKDSKWTPILNAGIEKLRKSGELEKIVKTYVAE
ncbi:transporter substrate-binding domain-containing protein [Mesorhizobium sp. 1M-11]|uniref:ABC transporter substrate-binding protein n=1 Tax=Mesorhizobium sp. 1M-11 TaxID=1529006 RepID=UPI0006C769F3|nr:transporter substrate-binding domain-containing protein [Mesorhizobium sp. 1M-11]